MRTEPTLTLADMKEITGISIAAIQKLLDQLIQKKYVERSEVSHKLDEQRFLLLFLWRYHNISSIFITIFALWMLRRESCWG